MFMPHSFQMFPGNDVPHDYVAHWTMDNISGSALVDESPNNNAGIISGAVAVSGYIGDALSFDGVNDEVEIPDSPSMRLGAEFSFGLFVKVNAVQAGDVIFQLGYTASSGEQIYLQMIGGNFYLGIRSDTDVNSGISISTSTWYHIGITYDGADVRLYVNGSLEATAARSLNIRNGKATLGFFENASNNNKALWSNCVIDQVYIYDYKLSDAQITALSSET